jgi:amino-acid N-acetyltransferase
MIMSNEAAVHSVESVSDQNQKTLIRKARPGDVNDMYRIINHYAEKQLMLPKTQLRLYEFLRDYTVATENSAPNRVLGCGALHIYWEDLAEIRALAVDPEISRGGIGTSIVNRLLDEARGLDIGEVFVFTYVPEFFGRFGFVQVEHSDLPLKVYNECFNCPKFNKCDELAMVLHL